MRKLAVLLIVLANQITAQVDSSLLTTGSKAPSFILNLHSNGIQSYTMPYMKKLVLLHFWSSDVITSRQQGKNLTQILKKYRNAQFKNAEGFEVIAIAVQNDKVAWKESIASDSITDFNHGIALRGLQDDVCKKYSVFALPTDILVSETGIILAIDPRMADLENILDEQKNTQPLRRDIAGILAQSSDKQEVLKFGGLYLFNGYGDTIARTTTNVKGVFKFTDVKLNQNLAIKVDNKVDINTSDPLALYTSQGDFLLDGRTRDEGFVLQIPARISNKLIFTDTAALSSSGEIDVIKNLAFTEEGKSLTPKDEQELNPILRILQKNKVLQMEVLVHTDVRASKEAAMQLTSSQAEAVKKYFEKNGIQPTRIQAVAKGNSELRKICEGEIVCDDNDHRMNRRVEFVVYKN